MKRSELKTGMRVETMNGDMHIFYKKAEILIDRHQGMITLDEYNNKFICSGADKHYDIVKIFNIPDDTCEIFNFGEKGELLWERKEEKPILELDGIEYSESTLRSIIKKATE